MQVEGAPVSGMPIKVHAAYDPITAAECEVADGFDPKLPLVAGASTQLVIQVRLLRHRFFSYRCTWAAHRGIVC